MTKAGVVAHYQQTQLSQAIRTTLEQNGKSVDAVTVDDLAPVDEFHVGGRAATRRLCDRLEVRAEHRVLDLGCGIGGLARHIASTHGAHVTGIDLTPAYIETASVLTAWVGLSEQTSFLIGSITDLGFGDDTFDRASQLHVGMNIAEKQALFHEVGRVLRPGARFGIYDIMVTDAADTEPGFAFPVPWAADASFSHLASASVYMEHLVAAGFDVVEHNDRSQAASAVFAARAGAAKPSTAPAPSLGLHLLMGPDVGVKVGNMAAAIGAGRLAPTEIIAVKR